MIYCENVVDASLLIQKEDVVIFFFFFLVSCAFVSCNQRKNWGDDYGCACISCWKTVFKFKMCICKKKKL